MTRSARAAAGAREPNTNGRIDMAKAFADICFTDSVRSAQTRYGSREANQAFEHDDERRDTLVEQDSQFIAARDSFYQATVSQGGWPYVQHRGGPVGFLRVLDERTIGYADFSGNRQYLSVGNLGADDRISLILMDYPNRRRLKLWGRARIVHEDSEPDLVHRLEIDTYRARVERGVVIRIEAIEWNCPQHILPRYSEAEMAPFITPLVDENRALKAHAIKLGGQPEQLGEGTLELVVSGLRQLTPQVRAFELRHAAGAQLPVITAGAHLAVPVQLHDGSHAVRHYSISSDPARRDAWEIAVLRGRDSHSGSAFVHETYRLGLRLHCALPRNDFELVADERPVLLIAGGIGITPLRSMALSLRAMHRPFLLHYAGRSRTDMAYAEDLAHTLGDALRMHPADTAPFDLQAAIAAARPSTRIHLCGPQRMLEDARAVMASLGRPQELLVSERFAAAPAPDARPLGVELRRSGLHLQVAATQSILDAVEAAGVRAPSSCRNGSCGACAVRVLAGRPAHADSILSPAQRQHDNLMCICVSRSATDDLVLDL